MAVADAFDFSKWTVNGASTTDIRQQSSPTCVTLATLASAARADISFDAPKITSLGNNTYGVKLYDHGKPSLSQSIWTDNDPAPSVDPRGYNNPEFWTILMQRGRMEHFYGVTTGGRKLPTRASRTSAMPSAGRCTTPRSPFSRCTAGRRPTMPSRT